MSYETVAISVRVEGTCANGHLVYHTLSVTVVKGSHGIATAGADCPSPGCGLPVHLASSYSA